MRELASKELKMVTQSAAEQLNKMYEERKAKLERLQNQLTEAQKELEAIGTTLKLMGYMAPSSTLGLDLSGMTQIKALIAIARANGGVLTVKTARRMMLKAGMFTNPKNSSSILFTTISRSKRFEKIESGKYRLLPEQSKLEPFALPAPVAVGEQ
jgi:predicted RNase H-like nuclease (RuvC/YqgF family)